MKIFTDSSYDEKRKIAGIGIYVVKGASNRTISNWIKTDDNNFAEMFAVYQAAILGSGKDCTIYTDSQAVLCYLNRQENPKKPRTQEQYIRHKRLQLLAYKIRKLNPRVQWTKGHQQYFQSTSVANQIADSLAKQGRAKFYIDNLKQRD